MKYQNIFKNMTTWCIFRGGLVLFLKTYAAQGREILGNSNVQKWHSMLYLLCKWN